MEEVTRVVVVGATGNVGTAVLRRLHRVPGLSIVGVARRLPDATAEPYAGVEWHSVDVGAPDAVERLVPILQKADAVVHLAWALQPTHDIPEQERTDLDGTENVLHAAARADVAQVVVASSVGAYSPADKHLRVDESWPTEGVDTATYSIHKAKNERLLERFRTMHPDMVVTWLRPGLVFQRDAAVEIAGLFLGRLVPTRILKLAQFAALPSPYLFVVQAVHADDLADAYWRVIERRAAGPFNVAADPVLTPPRIARALGMRGAFRVPLGLVRRAVTLLWHARIIPIDAGWVDIAASVPIMSTDRARRELDWEPRISATDALADLAGGLRDVHRVAASPPLSGDPSHSTAPAESSTAPAESSTAPAGNSTAPARNSTESTGDHA